jgi:hypothetical protein
MNSRRISGLAFAIACLLASAAIAGSLYLNGQRIDGVTNQKFEKCTVTIDANGDVFIVAPGYMVQGADTTAKPKTDANAPTTTVTGLPGKRYWLIKDENYPGKTQYDIDIYINSVWFKRIRSDGEQVIKEITSKLQAGPNVIHFAATKNIGDQRKSFSPQVYLRIIIGEGNIGGNNVMIENPLIQYKRTANETGNFNEEFTISVQ